MHEIRIHGRGGQGAVTAAELIAMAAFHDGKYSQAFPHFGVERRGAPVVSFARIDDKFIRLRSQVYAPNALVVFDPTLLNGVNALEGLKTGGMVVVNSEKSAKELGIKTKACVVTVDATKIALEIFGKPFVNTTILGAFAAATKLISLEGLKAAAKERFEGEAAEKNVKAIELAYNCVRCK